MYTYRIGHIKWYNAAKTCAAIVPEVEIGRPILYVNKSSFVTGYLPQKGDVVVWELGFDRYYDNQYLFNIAPADDRSLHYVSERRNAWATKWFDAFMWHVNSNSLTAYEKAVNDREKYFREKFLNYVDRWSSNYILPTYNVDDDVWEQRWFDDDKYI